eukprot:scaffold184295_cov15-Prasinocladus_malaysianus.AAC.1
MLGDVCRLLVSGRAPSQSDDLTNSPARAEDGNEEAWFLERIEVRGRAGRCLNNCDATAATVNF